MMLGNLSVEAIKECAKNAEEMTNKNALTSLLSIAHKLPEVALTGADWQTLLTIGLFLMTPLQRDREKYSPYMLSKEYNISKSKQLEI